MRDSTTKLIIGMLVVMIMGLLMLFLFQTAWLKMIMYMLNSNQSTGLPVASTPITGFAFPTARAPVSPGVELTINEMGITVTRVTRPADYAVGNTRLYDPPEKGQEYLMVAIKVRCLSYNKTCHLTEFDFGVHNNKGRDYTAEFSSSFSDDLKGLFEGGDISPGRSLAGSLIFIIQKEDRGLVLVYPRMYAFGGPAEFLLGK